MSRALICVIVPLIPRLEKSIDFTPAHCPDESKHSALLDLCQFTFEDMKHVIHEKISSVNISDRPIYIYSGQLTITQTETNIIEIKNAF